MTVVGNLEDRSELSDEMEDLCAKLPIYIVIKGDVDPNDIPQITDFDDIPNTRKLYKIRRALQIFIFLKYYRRTRQVDGGGGQPSKIQFFF